MSQAIDTTHAGAAETSKGIQELIALLRDKGVNAGKTEGTKILSEAEQRSKWIVTQAQEEADKMLRNAERDAKFIRESGTDALELAYRDIKLKLKDELSSQFAAQMRKLVAHELRDPETLKKLLVSAAAQSQVPDEDMRIFIPDRAHGLNELRADPDLLAQGSLIEMLSEVARALFSNGVEIKTSDKTAEGLTISLRDGDMIVDISDQSLTDLLLAHLQPRFRAILEGVVA